MIKENEIYKSLKVKAKERGLKITQGQIEDILNDYTLMGQDIIKKTKSFKIPNIGVLKLSSKSGYQTEVPTPEGDSKSVEVKAYNAVYFNSDINLKRKINS